MAAEEVLPNAVSSLSNLTGAVTDIDEGETSPDGLWITSDDDGTDSSLTVDFATATADLDTATNAQTVKIYVRKSAAGGTDPTVSVDIFKNGSSHTANVINAASITSESGEWLTGTWSATGLTNQDGSTIDARITCTRSGGSPGSRRSMDLGTVSWAATTADAVTLDQDGFRFRSDDAPAINANGAGDWEAALNTNVTMSIRDRFRLRFLIQSVGALTDGFTLQYKIGAGSWTDAADRNHHTRPTVTLSMPEVMVVPSDQYADLAATTQILGSGTFVAGDGCETPDSGSVVFTANTETELEFCVKVNKVNQSSSQHIADGTEIQFRLTQDDGTALTTYTNTPKLTVGNDPGWLGTVLPEMGGDFGPFVDGNDNMYVVCERTEDDNVPAIMKSTDDGVTWVEMDNANHPTVTDMEANSAVLVGDELRIVHFSDPVLTYLSYYVSTHSTNADEWNVGAGAGGQVIDSNTGTKVYSSDSLDMIYRSGTSDYVVTVAGSDGGADATTWVRSGVPGTWDARFEIDAEASTDFAAAQMVEGEGGVIHLVYQDQTNGNIYHRELGTSTLLTSADLGTRTLITNDTNAGAPPQSFTKPAYYLDGAEENIVIGYHVSTGDHMNVTAMIEGSPGSAQQASDDATEQRLVDHEGSWDKALVVDGTKIYAFWIDATNKELMLWAESDDLAGFSTPATFKDLDVYSPQDKTTSEPDTEWDGVYAKVITHGGGKVIAVMSSYAGGGSGLTYWETPLTQQMTLDHLASGSALYEPSVLKRQSIVLDIIKGA